MKQLREEANVQTTVDPSKGRLEMFPRIRRLLLVASLVGVLACAVVGATATPALGYGKATWQTALTGTFVFPTTGFGVGFWGWCDFAGGVTSGSNGDCEIAEYLHLQAGTGWTCELSIDGRWVQGPEVFDPSSITFHMTGSLSVHPASLTPSQENECVGFFTTGDPTYQDPSRTFSNVDTFIPASPGHFNIDPSVVFPGAVGEFNFTVTRIP